MVFFLEKRDIAKTLGVNVSSVSRALKGQKGVSEELRQKIERMATENGYTADLRATGGRRCTRQLIGIMVPDMSFNHNAQIIKRIESEAQKAGYLYIVADTNDRYENEVEIVDKLLNLQVAGIIVSLSQETTDYSHLLRVKEHNIPLVLFDRAADVDASRRNHCNLWSTGYIIDGGYKESQSPDS